MNTLKLSKRAWSLAAAGIALTAGAAAIAQVNLREPVNPAKGSQEWKDHFAVDFIENRPAPPSVPLNNAVRLEVGYKGKAAGFDIGRILMDVKISDSAYAMDYRIEQQGIARWFSTKTTDSKSVGTLKDGKLTSLFYEKLEYEDEDDYQYVDLVRDGPNARFRLWSDPKYELYWPVPEAYALDTVDPIASQILLGMVDTPAGKDPCDRTIKIYDGKRRWTMTVSYDREDTLRNSSSKRYAGPAIRCKVSQERVAGYKPEDIDEKMPDGYLYLAPVPEAVRSANFAYIPVEISGDYGWISAVLEAKEPKITGPDGTVYKMYKD